jgi:hypothetical protein
LAEVQKASGGGKKAEKPAEEKAKKAEKPAQEKPKVSGAYSHKRAGLN